MTGKVEFPCLKCRRECPYENPCSSDSCRDFLGYIETCLKEEDPCEGCKDFGSWYCKTCCPCRADWEDEDEEDER